MDKIVNREFATSVTALLFVVMGISGVMMFFHLSDRYVKEMHEILGLVFVIGVFLHIFFNFKSMQKYFNKTIFKILSAIVIVVSMLFVFNVKEGQDPKRTIIESVFNASLQNYSTVLGMSIDDVKDKLDKRGFKVDIKDTIQEISTKNHISPFEVVDIITQK
ncbi:DUF4405 domain-containing protein [bacterium]|nr:DUF4405 domain-containing protein [bacterium]MBU1883005.1 DUF4405 domain-containing protein [bacterium]